MLEWICISPPEHFPEEIKRSKLALDLGAKAFHLRKPNWDIGALRRHCKHLPEAVIKKTVLHDHPELLQEFPFAGFHYNRRFPFPQVIAKNKTQSISLHNHQPFPEVEQLDYAFLSPIFDSVSKPDVKSAFSPESLRTFLKQLTIPVFALGGITASRIPEIRNYNFHGVAILGYLWEKELSERAFRMRIQHILNQCLENPIA